ncbi:hypothetical protein E3O25_11915 [Cryobacterium sp. TMT1-3]|uniref:hypothetical protein n=1 Tax=Cryobacterium sp. TMT1-3 TaxID=1259237 RepID=UPI00106DB979|nr:hypothetical protein [Cryobacterium sp. TMT1-3]TFC26075.1 hypothetical protein E3O25_11915 [Cryobacterium sp. TMT1-3]
MSPDDDERGIDWLASQLDPNPQTDPVDGTIDADAGLDSEESPATPTAAEQADAPAPATRFGRRARRSAEPVAEPAVEPVVEPIAPPVAAAPAGPAPWWTTPLPQPVATEPDAADAADPQSAEAGAPADTVTSEPDLPPADVEPERHDALVVEPAAVEPIAVEPVESVAVQPESIEPPSAIATVLLPVSDTEADAPDPAPGIRLGETAADQPTVLLTKPDSTAGNVDAGLEPPSRHRSRRSAPGTTQATLIWTAVGLLALIVLVGLYFLGQRLVPSPAAAPAPTASAAPTPTPTPTPIPEIAAAQPAGVHEWNTLFGGECLEPYASPWEEDFTVVDCAAEHTAQLVYRGNFGGDATTVFPGEAALAAQINLLCTAPGILDLTAAGAYPNLQMQGSYPITAEQWSAEPRNYYCFVSRASAEPLTASIKGPGPTA